MRFRALLYGLSLLGVAAGVGHAQVVAGPNLNAAPTDPPKIDGTATTPNSTGTPVPEVIKPASEYGDVIRPTTPEDPSAVLQPPKVDPDMNLAHPKANGEGVEKPAPK